jgi:hypothetical protein
MAEPVQMSANQFCAQNGYASDFEVLGHIHAGLRSAPTSKTYRRWYERKTRELQASRDAGLSVCR